MYLCPSFIRSAVSVCPNLCPKPFAVQSLCAVMALRPCLWAAGSRGDCDGIAGEVRACGTVIMVPRFEGEEPTPTVAVHGADPNRGRDGASGSEKGDYG
jgi:hypothetical protein